MKNWRCGRLYDDEEKNEWVRGRIVRRGYESLVVTPRGDFFIILEAAKGTLLQWVAPSSLKDLMEEWDRSEKRTDVLVERCRKGKKAQTTEKPLGDV